MNNREHPHTALVSPTHNTAVQESVLSPFCTQIHIRFHSRKKRELSPHRTPGGRSTRSAHQVSEGNRGVWGAAVPPSPPVARDTEDTSEPASQVQPTQVSSQTQQGGRPFPRSAAARRRGVGKASEPSAVFTAAAAICWTTAAPGAAVWAERWQAPWALRDPTLPIATASPRNI